MSFNNIFDRVFDDSTPNAVTVKIWAMDGKTVADASCSSVAEKGAPPGISHGAALPVPVAMNVALDAATRHGITRVVITIDDVKLWRSEWGILRY